MKTPVIKSKAGQYTWLQVLALVISALFYWQGNVAVAMILLFAGTLFGVAAAVLRVRQAKKDYPQAFVKQRRRR